MKREEIIEKVNAILADQQTQRAQLFERNLLADGFTLLPWQVNN